MSVRCVLKDVGPGLGEGPCWWKERGLLIWVQINKSKVSFFDPKTSKNCFLDLPSHVGAVVPTSEGDLLAATASGFIRINPETGRVTELSDLRPARKVIASMTESAIHGEDFGQEQWHIT